MAGFDFLKEEYLTLRKEVEVSMAELGTLETHCVFAVGAGYFWLATKPLDGTFLIAWLIPPLVVVFGALRSWSIAKHLGWLGEYLSRIEARARVDETSCIGWEHFLTENDPKRLPLAPRRGFRGKVTTTFWWVFFFVTLAFGAGGFCAQWT